MRFRASIENVPTFHRIIQSIEKLQKKCIIKFTETHMHLICNSDTNEGGIQVWSQVKVDSLFSGYRIQSNASNTITVNISSEALLTALRSASPSSSSSSYATDEVVMKLAKKNDQAVLSFEITGTTRLNRRVKVTHDVKIEVLKPTDVEKLNEPMCPEPDVQVVLPPLQKLRTIVDRMRPMSEILAIHVNNNGCLRLSIHTESVKVETLWLKCSNAPLERESAASQSEDAAPDPDKHFSVNVSIRSFIKFLNSHVVSTTTIACVCQDHCLILYVYIGDVTDAGGVLTFYIPAILDG